MTIAGHRVITCASLAICLASCQTAAPAGEFDAVLQKPDYVHAHWGIHVEDLITGQIIISRNSEHLFAPASNTKLFSVAAAFEEFGADQRFVTAVHQQGDLSNDGDLLGELILRPTGDLTLGGRDDGTGGIAFGNSDHIYANGNPNTQLTQPSPVAGLESLAAQVRAAGIRSVRDVVIDDRLFRPSESTGSGPNVVTPIVINDNLIDFIITPMARGELASVEYRPQSPNYVVESRVRTTVGTDYGVRVTSPRPDHFILTGSIPLRYQPQVEVHEVHDAATNARMLMIEALQRAGVSVAAPPTGRNPIDRLPITTGALPIVARLLSAPFAEEAKLILKVSHNLHASTLPLLIAAQHGADDLRSGLAWQGRLLRRIGVDVDQIAFGGAAGGARADMTTPRVTVQLLRAVASRPYYEAFRHALPVLGVDGTLFQIGTDSPARGEVQAKTGTYYVYDVMNERRVLTSKALGGYLRTVSGREFAFNIVVNNVHLSEVVTPRTIGQDLGAIATIIQQSY